MPTQAGLGADLRNFEDATAKCKTCGATAHIDPKLYEDGRARNEKGEVTMLEMRCENGHGFTKLLDHPECDIK